MAAALCDPDVEYRLADPPVCATTDQACDDQYMCEHAYGGPADISYLFVFGKPATRTGVNRSRAAGHTYNAAKRLCTSHGGAAWRYRDWAVRVERVFACMGCFLPT